MRGRNLNINNKHNHNYYKNQNEELLFKYENTKEVNSFINGQIQASESIIFLNKEGDIYLKSSSGIKNYQASEILDSTLKQALNLLKIMSNAKMILSYQSTSYKVLLQSTNYSHILKYYLLEDSDNNYLYNQNMYNQLISTIKKYNSLLNITNIEIKKKYINYNLEIIKKHLSTSSKIIIYTNNNEINLLTNENIQFQFNDYNTFLNIYLPELLKLYITKKNKIKINNEEEILNYKFININNNLYFLNFKEEVVDANVDFLKKLIAQKQYSIEINKNIIKSEPEEEYTSNHQENLNYGYINILLIAFILSTITIIICLLKY